MKSIERARVSDYKYIAPIREIYNSSEKIITVIVDCYYELDLVKQSIQSVLDQDYINVELMIVDNGSHDDISQYLDSIYRSNVNTALIKFYTNQFSWKDTSITVITCWNAGLSHCKGDIVGHLNYDDMLSSNCCTKMDFLFKNNNNCVTAAPLPVSINAIGEINQEFSKMIETENRRGQYIDGKKLALDYIQNSPKKYFSAPGGVLFTKKEVLVKYGGFDRAPDITQIIKFAIHGDSGFDSKAKLFWRHHDKQANKKGKLRGVVWCGDLRDAVKTHNIIGIWDQIFPKDQVDLLKKFIKKSGLNNGLDIAIEALRKKNFFIFLRVLKNVLIKCPAAVIYVTYYSLLEMAAMLNEKIFKVKNSIR